MKLLLLLGLSVILTIDAQNVTTAADSNEALCQANKNFCKVSCGHSAPTINTCDNNNLTWNCECPPGTNQTAIDAAFPVAFKECQNEFMKCYASCNSKQMAADPKANECYTDCQQKIQCGGSNAPKPIGKGNNTKNDQTEEQKSGSNKIVVLTTGVLGAVTLSLL